MGDQINYYAEQAAIEIAAGHRLDRTDYNADICSVPLEELSFVFDPRCRPWYLNAKADPNFVKITTFSSLDGGQVFVSISKAIMNADDSSEILGVTAIDLDMAQMQKALETFTSIQEVEELYLVSTTD